MEILENHGSDDSLGYFFDYEYGYFNLIIFIYQRGC